jgi:hypothetical protein
MAISIITTQQFLIQNLVAKMYQILLLNQINWINKTTNIKLSIETPSITQHFTKIETPQYPTCTNLHSTFKVVHNEQFYIHDKTIKLTYIFQITSFNNINWPRFEAHERISNFAWTILQTLKVICNGQTPNISLPKP